MGWFSRKKKQAPAPETPPASEAPRASEVTGDAPEAAKMIAHWDGQIAEIRQRLAQVLRDAGTECAALLPTVTSDISSLTRIWSRSEAQLHEFTEAVSDAWDEVSDGLSELDSVSHERMDVEGKKRDWAITELEIDFRAAERESMAMAAEKQRVWAVMEDARTRFCSSCGQSIASGQVGSAVNVTCPSCQTVNSVEPGMGLRAFASSGAKAIGDLMAHEHWAAMKRAENQIDSYRETKDVPMELLEHYQRSASAYFDMSLGVEGTYVPEQAKYIPGKVAMQMKFIEKKLRQHWQWRERESGGNS